GEKMREERGFVLTGMALLLMLPSFLLASCMLVVMERGEEGLSTKAIADKVWFTGRDAENLIRQMHLYRMQLDNTILGGIARTYERYTGLLVSLNLENSLVRLEVRDPGGTAKYSSCWQLEG
ncbi:MAG: hypothetical protein QW687_02235, partial [Candidatus Hadarchaeales archaeon]